MKKQNKNIIIIISSQIFFATRVRISSIDVCGNTIVMRLNGKQLSNK